MQKSKSETKRPIILSGLKACKETLLKRPESISRTYYQSSTDPREFIQKKGKYQPDVIKKVTKEELQRICKGTSHEGIVCYVEEPELLNISQLPSNIEVLLVLDHISNPHNYGTIFRICSFFNIQHVLQEKHELQARPSGAAMRVSQGGIEHCRIYECDNLTKTLLHLKKNGFTLAGTSISSSSVDYRTVTKKPVALILGNEETGIRSGISQLCDYQIIIPRKGSMESLNVAVATGILLEYFQRI